MFVAGYRGSPLGVLDQTFLSQKKIFEAHNIFSNNVLNEDLAAFAV